MVDSETINGFLDFSKRLNQPWLGAKFAIFDIESYGLLAASQISNIDFGRDIYRYRRMGRLSTEPTWIPVGIEKYGDITIRGSVLRNTTLWDKFNNIRKYLDGKAPLNGETIIISMFPNSLENLATLYNTKESAALNATLNAVPIRIVVAEGCTCVSYKMASADTNNSIFPLEEIVLRPIRTYSVSG